MTSPQDLIINLINQGQDDAEIARCTGISARTVRQIRRDIASDGDDLASLPLFVVDAGADSWRNSAVCPQTDSALFFPEKGGSTREAKRICRSCDVRIQCLEWAIANNEHHGVWGGMSDRERRAYTRARAAS